MQKPLLRVIKLNPVAPEVNNLFPGIKADRKLYDVGTYTRMDFYHESPGTKLVPFDTNNVTHMLYGPSVILFAINDGIYTQNEVDIVTQRETQLEAILYDIQAVFPNQIPSNLLGNEATEGDRAVLDIDIKEARNLLRETPLMRYHRRMRKVSRKLLQRINKLHESIEQVVKIVWF